MSRAWLSPANTVDLFYLIWCSASFIRYSRVYARTRSIRMGLHGVILIQIKSIVAFLELIFFNTLVRGVTAAPFHLYHRVGVFRWPS